MRLDFCFRRGRLASRRCWLRNRGSFGCRSVISFRVTLLNNLHALPAARGLLFFAVVLLAHRRLLLGSFDLRTCLLWIKVIAQTFCSSLEGIARSCSLERGCSLEF